MDTRATVLRYLTEVLDSRGAVRPEDLISDEPIARGVAGFRAAFPDLQVEVTQVVADGDLAAVHLTGRGTHRGVFLGCPPTGRSWEARCTAIYRVQGDRIAQAWVNWDLLSVMEQLGCVERARTVSA